MRVLGAGLGGGVAALVCVAAGACSSVSEPISSRSRVTPNASASPPSTLEELVTRTANAFERDGDGWATHGRAHARIGADGALRYTPSARGDAALELRTRAAVHGVRRSPEGTTVVLDHGDHEERVTNAGGSLEQSWTFPRRPLSPVVVRVAARGMRWSGATGTGHHFVDDPTGLGVRYGRATWIDAAGVRTDVPVLHDGDDLVLRVPDEAARGPYPAILDPTLSPELGVDSPIPVPYARPRVATSAPGPSGTFLVAWVDSGDDVARAVRVGADGQPTGATFNVGSAGNGAGTISAAWDDVTQRWLVVTGSGFGLRVTRIAASGTLLDATPKELVAGDISSVSVAFDGAAFFVAYNTREPSGTPSAKVFRVSGATATVDPTSRLTLNGVSGDPVHAACGLVATGCAVGSTTASTTMLARVSSGNAVLDSTAIVLGATGDALAALASDGSQWLALLTEGTATKVKGARISASGVVTPTTDIDTGTSISQGDLSWDGTSFVGVWQSGAYPRTVRAKRIAPDGTVLDATPVNVEVGSNLGNLSVASSGGAQLITWSKAPSYYAPAPLYARPYSGALAPLASASALSLGSNQQTGPAIAWNGSGYLVAWTDMREGPNAGATYMTRLSPTGAPLDAQATKIGDGCCAAVASNGVDFVVAWQQAGRLVASRVSKNVTALVDSPPIVVSNEFLNYALPSLAYDGSQYVFAWSSPYNALTGRDVYAARLTSAGTLLDPGGFPVTNASGPQEVTALGTDGNITLVVWVDFRADYFFGDLFGSRISRAGASLDPQGIPIWKGPQSPNPAAVVGGNGAFTVLWHDNGRTSRNGPESYDLLAARVSPAGALLDPVPMTVAQGSGYEEAVAVDMGDGVSKLVAWTRPAGAATKGVVGAFLRDKPAFELLDPQPISLAPQAGASEHPALAGGPPGTAGLVYQRTDPDGTPRVRFRAVSSGAVEGATCAASTDCRTRYCRDAVCCAEACDGVCRRCGTGGTCDVVRSADDPDTCTGEQTCDGDGSCKKKNGSVCARATECASGFCVESVCCNSACDGACDTCAETRGSCTPLPRGSLGTPSCSPNRCDGVSAVCATTCVTDGDCADGYGCDRPTKTCIAGSVCVDGQTSRETSGARQTCSPYACRGGKCAESCATVVDCAYPAACDESGRCVAAPSALVGGCDAAGPREREHLRAGGAIAALVLALAVRRRRTPPR